MLIREGELHQADGDFARIIAIAIAESEIQNAKVFAHHMQADQLGADFRGGCQLATFPFVEDLVYAVDIGEGDVMRPEEGVLLAGVGLVLEWTNSLRNND